MIGRSIIAIGLLAVALLAIGCSRYNALTDNTPLGIMVDRTNYTPLMSSTVGIGMTPDYPSTIDNNTVSFRWHTDYGYFLSWSAPDFKVRNNGMDVTTTDQKVYWSYDPADMDKEKPQVRITLTMIDKASGRTLNTTGIGIGWENRHIAHVI